VTICTKDRKEFFGNVEEGKVNLSESGEIAHQCWNSLPGHYLNCSLDSFVIMPNHVYGIIVIDCERTVGNGLKPFPTHGLSEIMRGFKTFSSRKINERIRGNNEFQWQKSFYDRIIRDKRALQHLRQYIQNNPLKWGLDIENIRTQTSVSYPKNCRDYYNKIIAGG
jgi:putative transposase